jgi:hypothetical protein
VPFKFARALSVVTLSGDVPFADKQGEIGIATSYEKKKRGKK